MTKKVFVSYSWGKKEHQDWVVNLSKRLMNNTIDVVLDRWDLKDGNDLNSFMETMVKSDDVFRVLILCDRNYQQKADGRKGGVGTETQIITPKVYEDVNQEKFIPLLLERDGQDKPYLPIYLASRKYIDFSKDEFFESSYSELLRNILEIPEIPKPKLGNSIPSYLIKNDSNNIETNSIVRTMQHQLQKSPVKINDYANEFIDVLLEKIWDFELDVIPNNNAGCGKAILDSLISFKEIREDFILFAKEFTKPNFEGDIDILINFFEKKPQYLKPRNNVSTWSVAKYENLGIIFYELFLYTITVALKNKNFKFVGDLLHSRFYFKEYDFSDALESRYTYMFPKSTFISDYYKQEVGKTTGVGEYIISTLSSSIGKEEMVLSDMLCYYVSSFKNIEDNKDWWYPYTFIYDSAWKVFFKRLSSDRHFNKVKEVFDVENIEELKAIIENDKNKNEGKQRVGSGMMLRGGIPFMFELIDAEKIGLNK